MNLDMNFTYEMLDEPDMEYFDRFNTPEGWKGFRVISPSHAIFRSKKTYFTTGAFLLHVVARQPSYNFGFCTITDPMLVVVYQNEERYFIGKITFAEYRVFKRLIARDWTEYCSRIKQDLKSQTCHWQQEGF